MGAYRRGCHQHGEQNVAHVRRGMGTVGRCRSAPGVWRVCGFASAAVASWSLGSAPSRGGCVSTRRNAWPSGRSRGLPVPVGRARGPSSPGSTIAQRILLPSARGAAPSAEAIPIPVPPHAVRAYIVVCGRGRRATGSALACPPWPSGLQWPRAALRHYGPGPLAHGRPPPPWGTGPRHGGLRPTPT